MTKTVDSTRQNGAVKASGVSGFSSASVNELMPLVMEQAFQNRLVG